MLEDVELDEEEVLEEVLEDVLELVLELEDDDVDEEVDEDVELDVVVIAPNDISNADPLSYKIISNAIILLFYFI